EQPTLRKPPERGRSRTTGPSYATRAGSIVNSRPFTTAPHGVSANDGPFDIALLGGSQQPGVVRDRRHRGRRDTSGRWRSRWSGATRNAASYSGAPGWVGGERPAVLGHPHGGPQLWG